MFMNLERLKEVLEGMPAFREKQIMQFIFKNFVEDFDEMLSLPKDLREELKGKCSLKIIAEEFVSDNKDTVKALISLEDGEKIEAVLMRHDDGRNTVCVSCQVGCPMGCAFCATGKMGLTRNLTMFEILEQVLFFARYLKKEDSSVTNVVFMGMGEPMLNYDNVIGTVRMLNDKNYFNIGARHISISTCGLIEGIKKLAEERLQVNLAISLHSPTDEKRGAIMPVNAKYPLKVLVEALNDYYEKVGRKIMVEYLMLDGVNDTGEDVENLAKLLSKERFFLNLILYNPTGNFSPSKGPNVKKFKELLEKKGFTVTQRYRFGRGIKAACGQLVTEDKED
ncbi:23S rRNA (adenine(2503)-C(2))-methyltransferase RlmN [Candidatus Peregrinibacteria bacterium CG_4_10_14_0_2_um_filter_38_24]|nr:MAG: 23S rRNA (adenine(2503)-C(2))-methyltransferase RlmN [Candidatus Peregrinibacteria bacterium CG_4_10_14_0_2_um_filter_38_24]PJC38894.1 MAG: 23S rRNA (adenine(2503)-C(2))-methyltransferase RlmN [Candidatus Peregrinibacteria bacterium CG_4_9_14_0_2_um_filter_38_9]